jgi:geranylgeranyl diphosphate synthase type II
MARKTASRSDELNAFLSERRAAVESALDRLLPPAPPARSKLHEAMRYGVFSGGKRLRPILAIASFELVGGSGDAVMASACATELIHTYSLIHDDLPAMDNDDVRRGRPTTHKVFGEALAILAGDALLTLAFEIVASEALLEADRRVAILRELAAANGSRGMVGGQAADIEMEGADASLEDVIFIDEHKTGRAIRGAVRIGALAAGADERDLMNLTSYGEKIGLAFQITDDVLDMTGSAEELGKAVRKDQERGKLTYARVAGIADAAARAGELIESAILDLECLGENAWALRGIARFIGERRH